MSKISCTQSNIPFHNEAYSHKLQVCMRIMQEGPLLVHHMSTKEQLADGFTKPYLHQDI